MRVCMCPVRQFNVQLYVEKVFIAQKTSEDRGGKVRKRVKDMELLVGLLEKELGGGWDGKSEEGTENPRGGEDTSPDRVIIARQGKEAGNGTINNDGNGSTERSNNQRFPSRMRRDRVLARCSAHKRTGRAVPSPAHADFKWY